MAEDGQKKRPPQPREPAPRRSRKPEPGALQETDIPVALRSRLEHVARPLHVPIHIGLPPGLPPQPIDGIPHPPPERLPAPLPRPRPRTWITRTVRLQFIATTNTIAFDPQLLVPVVTAMNGFFGPGKIEFVYDPARDFVVEDNTLLDQDWELVDVGSLSNPESIPPTVDDTRFHKERQRVAAQHIGKLVVYISLGSNLEWQGTGGWAVRERGFHYSSTSADYVATAAVYGRPPGGSIDPNTLAHEIGHYLHEFHTMGYMPTTIAAAADSIRTAVDSWGWSRNQALRVFDADYPFVIDTPPDPGPDLFAAANGAACGGPDYVDVPVTFANGSQQTFRDRAGPHEPNELLQRLSGHSRLQHRTISSHACRAGARQPESPARRIWLVDSGTARRRRDAGRGPEVWWCSMSRVRRGSARGHRKTPSFGPHGTG